MTPTRPEWSPHLWEGLDYFAFWRLLARARFAVGRAQVPVVMVMSAVTLGNTLLGWLQQLRFGGELARTPLPARPLFVLGHWRTGTTLLHELLMLDPRLTTPTTPNCFLPLHHLLSEEFVTKYLAFLMPEKRPMDNMPAGWDRPQEEEFALALLGQPSPYTDIAFPNSPPLDPGSLDLSGLTRLERLRWGAAFRRFVRTLVLRDPRRLVLKSPPHTARIPELLKLFPDAQFIHLRRDPKTVYASTLKLWYSLSVTHGLQTPIAPEQFEAKVLREFRTVHERYLDDRHLIPPGNLIEVRFEDLTLDLVAGMGAIYEGLGLGDFAAARPHVERYALANKNYERNRFVLDAKMLSRLEAEWGDLSRRLGYGPIGV